MYSEASKSPASVSTSSEAIFFSWSFASSAGSTLKSGSRTSSGHSIVCITITPSRTRSTASVMRCRSDTVTSATRSVSTSASRSSAYAFVPALSGSR